MNFTEISVTDGQVRNKNTDPAEAFGSEFDRKGCEAGRTAPGFKEILLAWYDSHRRFLPWRENPSPYHVWLSEIMLQQTRVEAVRDYYQRFLDRFPTIEAFAGSSEDEFMKLWQGLGYYSRVRNMHKAAVIIMREYGGEMPHTAAALQQLPGIGRYTAAAIASIAYGENIPAVDGNLLRIFSRLTYYRENIRTPRAQRAAERFFHTKMEEISGGHTEGEEPASFRPGDFNQALMDLGNLVCMPGTEPRCADCPLQKFCKVHIMRPGEESMLPAVPKKKARKIDLKTVFLIRSGDEKVAIHKRPDKGLLAGMYEFPNAEGWLSEKEALTWLGEQGVPVLRITGLPDAVHLFTHREWHMHGYEVRIDSLGEEDIPFLMVGNRELREVYSIPSAFRAYLNFIL